jgi:signal transduction histidine kinase
MRTLVRWFKTFPPSRLHLLTGFLLSSAVGAACYFGTASMVERDGQDRFLRVVRTAQVTILGRVKSYVDVLYGTASLFHMNPELSADEFHGYVDGLRLDKGFLGIETINFARRVTEAERPAFEQRMNASLAGTGAPPFRINPPGPRTEYLPLTYIAPASANFNRLGVDLMGRAGAIPTILQARDSGDVGASGIPIQLRKPITGLGMRMAVYRPDMPTGTIEQRRAAYIGSVGIGFSVEGMMRGIIKELPFRELRLQLIGIAPAEQTGEARHRYLLYDTAKNASGTRVAASRKDHFQISLPIEFSQRNWEAHFSIPKAGLHYGVDSYAPSLALSAGFLSTALLYALFHSFSSSRRHAVRLAEEMTRELRDSEENLQLSNAKLRQLGAHAEHIKESERKRIAREIHDDLGQNLLALRIEADMLASRTGERHPLLHDRAQRTLIQIDSTIKSVRQIINDLRPNVLDLGLNAAVDWQISEFQRRTGVQCQLLESENEIEVNDRCATALFRILQESLSNISRHAGATYVHVELRKEQDRVSMSISDNGVGLRPGGRLKPGSFGLVGIEERVKILGGRCVIGNRPGGGMSVDVTVPLSDAVTTRAQPSDADEDQSVTV